MKRSDFHIFLETDLSTDLALLTSLGYCACQNISSDFDLPIADLNVVILPDETHTQLNIKHLNHNYSTDVLTFNLSDNPGLISGEIYLNHDVILANAREYQETALDELLRIIIHGTLHLMGLNDQTEHEQKVMREKEDFYLNQAKVSCET